LALPTVPLDEIYRDVVLDHYRSPRGRKSLEQADATADGQNPLCGDEVSIQIVFDGDRIKDVAVKAGYVLPFLLEIVQSCHLWTTKNIMESDRRDLLYSYTTMSYFVFHVIVY